MAMRTLFEKAPMDRSAFVETTDGSQVPQLFGGSLIEKLVAHSDESSKTQKGFDHIFGQHFGVEVVRAAKRSQPPHQMFGPKRRHFSDSRESSNQSYYPNSRDSHSGGILSLPSIPSQLQGGGGLQQGAAIAAFLSILHQHSTSPALPSAPVSE